jgi:site-specific recombinase XerD
MSSEISNLIEEFATELSVGKGFSPNTVKAYLSDCQDLASFMESKNQTEITDLDLE